MMIFPAQATGWFWHCLARETGKVGHLIGPDYQRGPWPWFPYHLDCGTYALWNPSNNTFNFDSFYQRKLGQWRRLLVWAQVAAERGQAARWAIVPDVPGHDKETFEFWHRYAPEVIAARIPLAIAVQDGMTADQVKALDPAPDVICIGGSTFWKWANAEKWTKEFPRVHVLRCNSPERLEWLEKWGVESTDGTGWNRGDRTQTAAIETWARRNPQPRTDPMYSFVSRKEDAKQMMFA